MERVKDKYPKFYNEYTAGRIIKATGVRHRKPPNTSKPPNDPAKK